MKPMTPDAAYVLNRRPYKESSLLLDIFSCHHGRQSILAQGALKSKKGWAAQLQVFQPLLLSWTGRNSLKTLVSVDVPSTAIMLQNERLYSAYYLNELLLKLYSVSIDTESKKMPGQAFQSVFLAYANALGGLQDDAKIDYPLRTFEITLLEELGVFPDCTQDIFGSEICPDRYYQFQLHEGFRELIRQPDIIEAGKPIIKGEYINYIRHNFQGMSELSSDLEKEGLRQIKRLMRLLIDDILDGKEIMSRALFHRYQPKRSTT